MVRVDDGDVDGARPASIMVTLDRPERRNAVDLATLVALFDAQRRRRRRPAVVVLTGAPPAFCAGADLSGVENDVFVRTLQPVLRGLHRTADPVIGAIDGPALGAGTQLAIACDLRVATPASRFGIPAAKLGIVVDQWTVNRLARSSGRPIARAMLLAAETFDGERCTTPASCTASADSTRRSTGPARSPRSRR